MNDIFIECFGELKDKRYKNKQYNLLEVIAKSIRQHWHIENNLHGALNVVFKEDDSTIKHEVLAQNMSWIRKMATFLLKKQAHTKKISIKNKMVANCCKPSNLLYYLEC